MAAAVNHLMLEFLAWVSDRPRTYGEAMAAWQTTCPRHTVWEDALIDGLVRVNGNGKGDQSEVTLTPQGVAILKENHRHKFPSG
jgi:hypothetical protein